MVEHRPFPRPSSLGHPRGAGRLLALATDAPGGIRPKVADYARAVLEALLAAGFRATLDHRPEKINAKIRDAQLEKIPAMLVVGAKEAEQQAVSYRDRTAGDLGAMPLAQAIARLKQEADARIVPPAAESPAPAAAEEAQSSTPIENLCGLQRLKRSNLPGSWVGRSREKW